MVASTDIKFYVHTNTNAPQLTNNFGCMIDVLDACLVNGYGGQTVSTLTASGTTVTATFGSAHNLMQYQVIEIEGATQTEYNGEHRILTVPNANTITFELAAAPSVTTATGTITSSLPSLGWEKPFNSTHSSGVGGKAAYRSTNLLLPSRPFLRVVDELDPAWTSTYAKYAKVGIVEDMTDIDTMLGVQAPYDAALPNKNWVGTGSETTAYNGWAKWFYASYGDTNGTINKNYTVPNGDRKWVIVGSGDSFYILNNYLIGSTNSLIPYGFGILNDYLNLDGAPFFLAATDDYSTAGAITYASLSNALTTTSPNSTLFLLRKADGTAVHAKANMASIHRDNLFSGYNNVFAPPSDRIPVIHTNQIVLEGNIPRGTTPFIKFLYQAMPYQHLDLISERNNMMLAVSVMSYSFQGQVIFNIGVL